MDNIIKAELIEKFRKSNNKLILLDYDGTLVDFFPFPEEAKPSEKLLDILKKLAEIPKTNVVIITGRAYKDIDNFLGHLPINLIAEHGGIVKINRIWEKQTIDNNLWKNKVLPILNQITLACPNSFIEEKQFSLSWHYRNAKTGYVNSRNLIELLDNVIHSNKLKILDGNQVIEILSNEIGKGKAVKNILKHNKFDYILSIGDDKTDEEMFEFLLDNPVADTIKVGKGNTSAKYKLDNVDKVISLLKQLLI
ncbi:MAG: trehalose-phosphatase [Bacteroidales bacterium]